MLEMLEMFTAAKLCALYESVCIILFNILPLVEAFMLEMFTAAKLCALYESVCIIFFEVMF